MSSHYFTYSSVTAVIVVVRYGQPSDRENGKLSISNILNIRINYKTKIFYNLIKIGRSLNNYAHNLFLQNVLVLRVATVATPTNPKRCHLGRIST